MNIRLARPADIPRMHHVRLAVRENRLADPTRVQPRHYADMLQSGRGWICEVGKEIVGFAIADLRSASIWALFVHPDYERRGIGRQLHDRLVQWLFAAGVERISLTTDTNTRAERFYRSAGWTQEGEAARGEIRLQLVPRRFGHP